MNNKGTILVIDDEESIRLLLSKALQAAGYQVTLAADYQEAIAHLERDSFDLALIDKNLPDKDGIELLREARRRDPEMECVIITGYASLDSAIEAMKIGAFDYITKPFDHIDAVIQRVNRAIDRRRQRDDLKTLLVNLADSNQQLANSMKVLRRSYLETAKVISRILEMRDPELYGRCEQIKSLAVRIGMKLGGDTELLEWLGAAALLHDLGQAGTIEHVLRKPDKLDPGEIELMKRHADIGAELMKTVAGFEPLAGIIRHHHERYDGGGYPGGLRGESIPLAARILAAADSFIAMISDRPHRKALDREQALETVREASGKQFDPQVVDALLDVVSEGKWEN